jgi:hypothetical protein
MQSVKVLGRWDTDNAARDFFSRQALLGALSGDFVFTGDTQFP